MRVVSLPHRRRTFWLLAAAIVLPIVVTLAAVVLIRSSPRSEAGAAPRVPDVAIVDVPPPAPAPRAAPVASPAPGRVAPRRVVAEPVADAPQGFGASPVPEPTKPRREIDAADVIAALREEGVHEGIAAFGIPGSHPPKSGILVPEDYALPEGYVRHYQSTDEGQQLPAILMFHPDYEFVNEQGEVLPLPEDMIVTPEMAPPDLAVDKVLEIPERPRGEPIR